MPLPSPSTLSPFSLPALQYGSAVPDYRLSDAQVYFNLVSPLSNSTLAIREPLGWDAIEWTLERDPIWHGVNFEFTGEEATLKFQQPEAVEFVTLNYQKFGPNGLVLLAWGLLDGSGSLPLQQLRLNLAKRKLLGGELTIPGERYSLHPDIKAKWDTVLSMDAHQALVNDAANVPIKIIPPAPSVLVLHSQRIKLTTVIPELTAPLDTDWQSFANGGTSIINGGGLFGGATNVFHFFYVKFPFDTAKASPNDVTTVNSTTLGVDVIYPEEQGNPTLDIKADGDYTLTGTIDFQIDARLQKAAISISPPKIHHYELNVFLVVNGKRTKLRDALAGTPDDRFMGAVRCPFSIATALTLLKGDQGYIYAELYLLTNRDNWRGTDIRVLCYSASLSVTASTYAPPSTTPAYPVIDVLKQFVAVLTGRTNAVQSSYYSLASDSQPIDGGGAHRLQTNGYSLRGFPGKPLQSSLQSELQSLQAIDAVGMAYKPTPDGDVMVVEPIVYWYRDTIMLTLSSYTVIEEETDSSYLHPSVSIGYSKYPDEGSQVLDEFNTKQEYILPMREGTAYTQVSDLIASGYAIEMTRRAQFSTAPSDSTSYDDDGFIICGSQLMKLTAQQSNVSLLVNFAMVSGKACMSFDLALKPSWFAGNVTFLVSGTLLNDGVYKAITVQDTSAFGPNNLKALIFLDRNILNESHQATLSISGNGFFQSERDESFSTVAGVIDPKTTYNLRLSPRFNLLRHARYLAGGLTYNSGSEPITCTFSKNNGTLRTQLADNASGDLNIDVRRLIQHTDSLQVADLRHPLDPLWTPDRFSVETKLTIDQVLYLRALLTETHPDATRHHGCIELLRDGQDALYAIVLKITFNPGSGKAVLTLLKKTVSLAQLQGQRGCSFYGAYVFRSFETAQTGTIDNWIERCTFGNFQ